MEPFSLSPKAYYTLEILLPMSFILFSTLTNSMVLEKSPNLSSFPNKFLFGTSSSSYQFEGAAFIDAKGLSNWDIFTHKNGNIIDGSNGDRAVDHYHLYPEDIDIMANLTINSYRFSISWARILPKGRFGQVNMAGIDHYSKLIDALLHKGIEPFVTLMHYDIPQELEERYGAWLSVEIRNDFEHYADTCFKFFGSRVKYWVTLNEPNIFAIRGYRLGIYPPARCSNPYPNCVEGDSDEEPLIAAHNMILCHADAVKIYRARYQKAQGGSIGLVMYAAWYEPFSDSLEDRLAIERAYAFFLNWFLDPIMFGKYPEEMRRLLGTRLPVFSEYDIEILRNNKLDFIGINHYTSLYIKDCIYSYCEPDEQGASESEGYCLTTPYKDGTPIGEPTAVDWLFVYPQGMEKIVTYIKNRYNNTPMFITENGLGSMNQRNASMSYFLDDVKRIEYMSSYLESLSTAIKKGADVRGYFAWSLLDNFEWTSGYTIRFGLYHVDFDTLKRTPKLSAAWYRDFIDASRSFHAS